MFKDLHTLNLADNSLAELEAKVFQMLTKLKILDLSRNPLEDLQPDVFKDVIVSLSIPKLVLILMYYLQFLNCILLSYLFFSPASTHTHTHTYRKLFLRE